MHPVPKHVFVFSPELNMYCWGRESDLFALFMNMHLRLSFNLLVSCKIVSYCPVELTSVHSRVGF